jgi:hypothetical protein
VEKEVAIGNLKVEEGGMSMSEGILKLVVASLAILIVPSIHWTGADFWGREVDRVEWGFVLKENIPNGR